MAEGNMKLIGMISALCAKNRG